MLFGCVFFMGNTNLEHFFYWRLQHFFSQMAQIQQNFLKKENRIIRIFPRYKINVFEVQKLHVNSGFHAAGMDHEIHFKENRIEQMLLSYYIGNIYVLRRLRSQKFPLICRQ